MKKVKRIYIFIVILVVLVLLSIFLYSLSEKGKCELPGISLHGSFNAWNEARNCCCDTSSYYRETMYNFPTEIPQSDLCCWNDEALREWCKTYNSSLSLCKSVL